MRPLRFVFAVQGEGRGHLTQALAVKDILSHQGHQVICVIVGKSDQRQIPDFFTKNFNVPVIAVESPNFSMDRSSRSINMGKTIIDNLLRIRIYHKSLKTIETLLKEHQPDVVINFYEPLIALYACTHRRSFKLVSIAHQYIYLHPAFRFPDGNNLQASYLRIYTWLTGLKSDLQLAISMYDLPVMGRTTLKVVPPLLRNQVFTLERKKEDFVLVYLLNSSYTKDIVRYHKKNPSLRLYCFTDSKEVKDQHNGELRLCDSLVFYSLSDQKFLDLMSRCKGLVCTAGFESVCEAMYLDKPVMMVPVKGHYEQYCNARDASRIGAGIFSENFDLGKLEDCLLFYNAEKNESFRQWTNSFESMFTGMLQKLLQDPENKSSSTRKIILPNPHTPYRRTASSL